MVQIIKTVFCPRCDKPYAGWTRPLAMAKMNKHWKLAHPEHFAVHNDQT